MIYPQEIGDFGVLVHGGLSVKKALIFNFISSLTAVLGAVLVLLVGSILDWFSIILIGITAGGFIYIAGSDLIPELHHETSIKNSLIQFLMILFGVGIMIGLLFLE